MNEINKDNVEKFNIILLSGGSGKRLWPLSNDIRSKQFLKLFKNDNGNYESMIQRVYRQIKIADPDARITIATSKSQVSSINNQITENINICVEPCRKDTFPAIVLAASYLHDVLGVDEEEAIVVCPVDPYVNENYFVAVHQLWELASKDTANLVLMGITPTYPSEKYGYIMPVTKEKVSKVSRFQEKPDAITAQRYIDEGGLWNSGIFAFKLKYILSQAHQILDFSNYSDLINKYNSIDKISFDYAIVEKEDNIAVLRFEGLWKDLGTWNTLTEAMKEPTQGNVILDPTCDNVHVINELDIPVLVMGVKNSVISASPDGILVSDKNRSSFIKPFVDSMNQQIMFAEKSWGSYRVIDVEEESLTVKVILKPGHRMNYHSHEKRDEVWTVISGSGLAIVDGVERFVSHGDIIMLNAGCKHTIIAGNTGVQLIEVQIGTDISVADKIKYNCH